MTKDSKWIFFYQVIMSFILMSAVLLGFIVAWILFSENTKSQKRPGINIKEL